MDSDNEKKNECEGCGCKAGCENRPGHPVSGCYLKSDGEPETLSGVSCHTNPLVDLKRVTEIIEQKQA